MAQVPCHQSDRLRRTDPGDLRLSAGCAAARLRRVETPPLKLGIPGDRPKDDCLRVITFAGGGLENRQRRASRPQEGVPPGGRAHVVEVVPALFRQVSARMTEWFGRQPSGTAP